MSTPAWLGPIRQTAFVVDDIDAAAAEWVAVHGVGPWFINRQVVIPDTVYRGTPTPIRAKMGLAQSGGQQIELIEPEPGLPSIYTEFAEVGGTGVHHICYWADLERAVAHFESTGAEVVHRGITPTGNEFLYMTGSCGVPYVEFIDPDEGAAAHFVRIADAALDWDGTDPIR